MPENLTQSLSGLLENNKTGDFKELAKDLNAREPVREVAKSFLNLN